MFHSGTPFLRSDFGARTVVEILVQKFIMGMCLLRTAVRYILVFHILSHGGLNLPVFAVCSMNLLPSLVEIYFLKINEVFYTCCLLVRLLNTMFDLRGKILCSEL